MRKIQRITIVNYHRILPKKLINKSLSQSSLIVSLETFKDQLDYFKTKYNILSIDSIVNSDKIELDFYKPNLIITFDDGWYDNYLYAFYELKKRDIPATIYLTSNYISTNKLFWPEEITFFILNLNRELLLKSSSSLKKIKSLFGDAILKIFMECIDCESVINKKDIINLLIIKLKSYPEKGVREFIGFLRYFKKRTNTYQRINVDKILTWKEIYEMRDHRITFGSHTHNHIILSTVSKEKANDEIVKSINFIESKLKKPIIHFSLPNGGYNKDTKQLLKTNGLKTNVSCINGVANNTQDKLMLHRKHINEDRFVDKNGKLCIWKCDSELSGFFDMVKNFFLKYEEPY